MIGYSIESPVFDPGVFLYRARKCGPAFHKGAGITRKDLVYPPKDQTKLGRLNRTGQTIFYSSAHKESVFFELPDLKPGDELVLTFWKTSERMFVNNIGYTEQVFTQFGAKRAVPTWRRETAPAAPGATQTVELSNIPPEVRESVLSSDKCRAIGSVQFIFHAQGHRRRVVPIQANGRLGRTPSGINCDPQHAVCWRPLSFHPHVGKRRQPCTSPVVRRCPP
jgi:hypothetical protein